MLRAEFLSNIQSASWFDFAKWLKILYKVLKQIKVKMMLTYQEQSRNRDLAAVKCLLFWHLISLFYCFVIYQIELQAILGGFVSLKSGIWIKWILLIMVSNTST